MDMCGAEGGEIPRSPTTLVTRARADLQAFEDECRLKSGQIEQLEKQVKCLTQQLHVARESEQKKDTDHREMVTKLEQRALADQQQAAHELCRVQHQLHCSETAASCCKQQVDSLSSLLRTLQMDKVTVEQRVRELETEVSTRRRLLDTATEQLMRFKHTTARYDSEPKQLRGWLQRLEKQQATMLQAHKKLELYVQYQNQRLQQLKSPGGAASGSHCSDTGDQVIDKSSKNTSLSSTTFIDELYDMIKSRDEVIVLLQQQLASERHTAVVMPFDTSSCSTRATQTDENAPNSPAAVFDNIISTARTEEAIGIMNKEKKLC